MTVGKHDDRSFPQLSSAIAKRPGSPVTGETKKWFKTARAFTTYCSSCPMFVEFTSFSFASDMLRLHRVNALPFSVIFPFAPVNISSVGFPFNSLNASYPLFTRLSYFRNDHSKFILKVALQDGYQDPLLSKSWREERYHIVTVKGGWVGK